MSEKTKQTIIEEGTEFDGKIQSDCGIRLSGMLQGEFSAQAFTHTVDTVPEDTAVGTGEIDKLKDTRRDGYSVKRLSRFDPLFGNNDNFSGFYLPDKLGVNKVKAAGLTRENISSVLVPQA